VKLEQTKHIVRSRKWANTTINTKYGKHQKIKEFDLR
jgi:hypothetical protein